MLVIIRGESIYLGAFICLKQTVASWRLAHTHRLGLAILSRYSGYSAAALDRQASFNLHVASMASESNGPI